MTEESAEDTLTAWLEEAIELRFGEAGDPDGKLFLPEYEVGPEEIYNSLLRTQRRLDRVDELLIKTTRAKHRLTLARNNAKFEADHAKSEAFQKNKSNRSLDSFTSASERNADAMLDSFAQLRAAHKADNMVATAGMAYEAIKQVYWGLSTLKDEHIILMRSFQFEASLGR